MRQLLIFLVATALSVVRLSEPPHADDVQDHSGVDVSGCTTQTNYHYYDVTGANNIEVKQSLVDKGPSDKNGKARYAYASWKLEWDWPKGADGLHQFDKVTVTCTADVFLPRYVPSPSASAEFVTEIEHKFVHIRAHEMRHVSHAVAGAFEIKSQVTRAAQLGRLKKERDANRVAFAVLERTRGHDHTYDTMTEFGKTEGIWIE
jgi:predicted secreted Zn-dependent protease